MSSRYDDRDDEFDDLPIRRDEPLSGLDAFFANTNTLGLVIFGLCCGCIPLVLSIVGGRCRTKGRSKATLLLIISTSAPSEFFRWRATRQRGRF